MTATRWRVWLVALVIFILGTTVGASLTLWLGIQRIRQEIRAPGSVTTAGERAATRIGNDLVSALHLTPAEASHAHAQIEEMTKRVRSLRRQANLDVAAELRSTMREIGADLPPEKREALRELVRRRFDKLGLPPPNLSEK